MGFIVATAGAAASAAAQLPPDPRFRRDAALAASLAVLALCDALFVALRRRARGS